MIREILKTPEQFQTLQIGDLIYGIEVGPKRPIISPNDDPTFIGIIKDLNAYEPDNGQNVWSLSDNPERFKATVRDIINFYDDAAKPHDPDSNVYCEVVAYRLFDATEANDYGHYAKRRTTELCLYYEDSKDCHGENETTPKWIPFRVIDDDC